MEAVAMSFFASLASKGFQLPKLGKPELNRVKAFFLPTFWGTTNPELVAQHVKAVSEFTAPGFHFADNFFTWCRNNSMLEDEVFVKAWQSNVENDADTAIVWRRYILACAAYHCVQLKGDFVECGAYTGVGVKTVVDFLGGVKFPKDFWVYDLFEHEDWMLHHSMPQHGPDLEARVRDKFKSYPQVKIFRGFIPDVFEGQSPQDIAYLHIDLNQAPAEIAALDVLFDRIVPGGIVILDDYEWAGIYRVQKLAEDPWFEARQYRVIPLPTGQGLVIKR
jgi:O-methyltransferase